MGSSTHARVRKGATKWKEKRPPHKATPRKSGGSASEGWAESRPAASCTWLGLGVRVGVGVRVRLV